MKQLKDMTFQELKEALHERAELLDRQGKWVYKDRTHKALLNEMSRRSGLKLLI